MAHPHPCLAHLAAAISSQEEAAQQQPTRLRAQRRQTTQGLETLKASMLPRIAKHVPHKGWSETIVRTSGNGERMC